MSKENFGSKIGAILAAAGSAVGLGNVWRFPTEAGEHGGAAFIIIYVAFMLLLGVPIMVSEFVIGRHSQRSVSESFYLMSGGRRAWRLMGLIPAVAGFLVLSYYAVVAGWTLYYTVTAGTGGMAGKTPEQFVSDFNAFSSDPIQPIVWMAILLIVNGVIVALGIKRGIERGAKIMMPALFIFILILVGCSLTLPGANDGLKFLFKPDFSKVDGHVVLNAMGQAFFSLSVGLCCLCTYACYFRKDVNLMKDAISVGTIDTMVAILSGIIIFPAVFSVPGITPNEGFSLVFITLPNVFQQVFASMPTLAYIFSLTFYLLLVMAALTSSISMLEMPVAYFHENHHMSRPMATAICTIVCLLLGAACALSFGEWSDIQIFGMTFFAMFDYIVCNIIMPLGALLTCLFVGWVVDERVLKDELTNGGTLQAPYYPIYRFIVRYFAPICIALIFINCI